jgi:DNA processing protein
MDQERKYWVGFSLVKGIGPVRVERLLEHFGSLQAAWEAKPRQLIEAGIHNKLCQQMASIQKETSLDALLEEIHNSATQILTWADPAYPERLRNINQSPFVLYLKGSLLDEDIWGAGVVGTRRYSDYGRQVTENITRTLAETGITIISGLARGIDGIAHRQALDAGGRSLAVLGSGLDQIYPPEHRELAESICQQGALISDYPPGTPPDGCNFPPRNRIISGLSRVVLVMEAGIKSGAMITASYAAEQGKEVFAVPGKITSPNSKGTNLLIKQGAHPLLDARDVLDLLNMELVEKQQVIRKTLPASPREAMLYNAVGDEPLHVDELSARTKLPIEEVTATLALMELKGMVRKTFGMKYVAVQDLSVGYRSS